MEVKFHQLRPGQRFQWQGDDYEKVNPLLARHIGNGAQRLLPRSTTVTVPDGATQPAAPPPADAGTLRQAFEEYHRQGLYWLERQDGSAEMRDRAREALELARRGILSALGEEGEHPPAFPDGNAD